MKLKIITTQKNSEHEIEWAELNTPVGNMIIAHGHAPLLIELTAHAPFVYLDTQGTKHSMNIVQGIAHVNRETLTILIPINL